MRAVLERGMKMRKVKVKRDELLERVKTNRENHIAEYEEAVIGYKEKAKLEIEKAMGRLAKRVDELEEGEVLILSSVHFNLEVPRNHEKDYDQVIQMLEMSVDDELEIMTDEFACYVMDDWTWKEDFVNVSNQYKAKR
jgi:hypothetical protein